MTIYKTDDYTWHRSENWDDTNKMARGEVSFTGQRIVPHIKNKGLSIYTINDISGLSEKERAALGVWHHVETRKWGDKEYPMFAGKKINPHRGDPNHYQYSDNLKLTDGIIVLFTPDGICHWIRVDVPKQFRNSITSYLNSAYTDMWGNSIPQDVATKYYQLLWFLGTRKNRYLRQRKRMAGMEGKSPSTEKRYPWNFLFAHAWEFKQAHFLFATVNTLGVLCNIIEPGQFFADASPSAVVFQEPAANVALSIGVPKGLELGDFKELLKYGLVGELRFLDSGFPTSTDESRLFELFKIAVLTLGVGSNKLVATTNRRWRQFLGAIECPTAEVIRFPLLKEGAYLSNESLVETILDGKIKRLRFWSHNISAYQNAPPFAPFGGFPSYMPSVEVWIGKPSGPEIKYTRG